MRLDRGRLDAAGKELTMIVQACLNGARPTGYHPRLPTSAAALAEDGASCILAGAAELHVHPRGPDGRESLLAVDNRDARASFSQFGAWISVSAPGVNILSTFPTSGPASRKDYGSISGTSMATPAVAGAVALIRSQFPDMNKDQVRVQLGKGTDDLGDPGFDKYYGHGRINLEKVLQARR